MYRQGDVLLIPVDKIPSDAIKQKNQELTILAYGEKTGHMHGIKSKEVQEFKQGEDRYFQIGKTVILSHGLKKEIEEKIKTEKDHEAIKIPAGKYRLVHQREYTPEKIRRVVD